MVQLVVILFIASFFRTVLIIVAVYYIIRFITRVVIPLFSGSQQNTRGNFESQNQRKEGDVTVEGKNRNGSHVSRDEGEYVDFEEID